jgi:hypothetical protein
MDAARDVESNYDGELIDTYVLQFWPGPPGSDRILRQTSSCAAYWHQAHRQVAPPPEQAAKELAQLGAEEDEWLQRLFNGRVPNQRLRAVANYASSLVGIDLDLTFALAQADDSVHRAVAAWAALQALEIAQLTDLPELAPSVAAIRRGGRAVAPFDGTRFWYEALKSPISKTPVPLLFPALLSTLRAGMCRKITLRCEKMLPSTLFWGPAKRIPSPPRSRPSQARPRRSAVTCTGSSSTTYDKPSQN